MAKNSGAGTPERLEIDYPYPFNRKLDTAFIVELAADFERVNLLEQTKTFRWYYDDDLSRVGNPRAALRRWMVRAHNRFS